MSLISVNGLSKHYGKKKALSKVSFDIETGEIVALLGPNGSGKTTMVKCMASLISPDEGEIAFNGRPTKNDRSYLMGLGAVLEGSRNIHWRLTVVQNAKYFACMRGASSASVNARMERLIELLDLGAYRNLEAGKLSTGNRQKVAVLCALVHRPSMVLMDEPTLGLDLATVEAIRGFIVEEVQREARTFLITSHDLHFIEGICERVLVIHEGRLMFDGTLASLKQKLYQYEAAWELNIEVNDPLLERLRGVLGDGGELHVHATNRIVARFNEVAVGLRLAEQSLLVSDNVVHYESKRTSMEKAYRQLLEDAADAPIC